MLIDTDVFVISERVGRLPDFSGWREFGGAFISSITVSELLFGVHRASTRKRQLDRGAFVEAIVAAIPALAFSTESARVHARMLADMPANVTVGAHDALIVAQAIEHGHAVLTRNVRDFSRLPGVKVVPFKME